MSGCEFYGFPRREGEDVCAYVERWNEHQKLYRPWEQKAPAVPENVRLPYVEREAGCDDD